MNNSPKPNRFRPATLDDLGFIADLLVDLYRKTGMVYGIKPDAPSLIHAITKTIKHGICLVGAGGCAGGYIEPFWWNQDSKMGTILFWNFHMPSGIHVLAAMRDAMLSQGATHIAVASHFPANRIARHYKKLGFHPTEIQFILPAEKRPAINGFTKHD